MIGVNRPSAIHTVAGGKGINVARVYQTLGGKALTTGFLGGNQGGIIARALRHEGIPEEFVRVRGESRICIAVIDPQTGSQTEINEPGARVFPLAVRKLTALVACKIQEQPFDFIVLSGSLPPGAPDSLYAELVGIANNAGNRVVLDSSGIALRQGIAASPWLIKPNLYELEGLLGRSLKGVAEVREAAEAIRAGGVTFVAASLGAEGALLVGPDGAWFAVPPPIKFASAVASGDSFVAAFLWSWTHGERPADPADALRWAVGAGAANAAVIGAGFCTRESVQELAARTVVHALY